MNETNERVRCRECRRKLVRTARGSFCPSCQNDIESDEEP